MRRVAQAQANLTLVTDAHAIKVSPCLAGHSDWTSSNEIFNTLKRKSTTGQSVPCSRRRCH